MNFKKILLFIPLFLIGVIFFRFVPSILVNFASYTFPILMSAGVISYTAILILVLKKYSRIRLVTLFTIPLVFVVTAVLPGFECDNSFFNGREECTCLGIEKYTHVGTDVSSTSCIGAPINKVCYLRDNGLRENKVPCEELPVMLKELMEKRAQEYREKYGCKSDNDCKLIITQCYNECPSYVCGTETRYPEKKICAKSDEICGFDSSEIECKCGDNGKCYNSNHLEDNAKPGVLEN